jgi:hypothetical protein
MTLGPHWQVHVRCLYPGDPIIGSHSAYGSRRAILRGETLSTMASTDAVDDGDDPR